MAEIKNLIYKDLNFHLPEKHTVTDEEIAEEVERFRKQFSEEEITDENETLNVGDTAHMDFCGYVNGEKFEGGEAKCYDLKIGSHSFIDGFEDQMVGMHPGEEKDVNVTFPENYVPDLAGKPAVFKVKLHAIKRFSDKPLTDETVKAHTKMQSVEEFKACYRNYLEDKYNREFYAKKQEIMLKEIVKNSEIEVSSEEIENEVKANFDHLENDLKNYGMSVEQFFEMNGTTREDETVKLKAMIEENIKSIAALEEIVKRENVAVSDEEIADYVRSSGAKEDAAPAIRQNMAYAKALQLLEESNDWSE